MNESIPNLGRDIVYDYQVVFDGGNNADCMYAVAEIYAWDTTKKFHSVRRPTADSIPWSQCVVLPGAKVECSSTNTIAAAAFMYDNRPVIASLTATSAAAVVGSLLGTVANEFGLKVGNTGFICVGVVKDVSGRRFVYVRPTGGGGGSASLTVVQATSDGAAGVIPVKVITLKADVAASPNFEQATGDPSNVNYYRI